MYNSIMGVAYNMNNEMPDVVDRCKEDDLLQLFDEGHAFMAMGSRTVMGVDMGSKDYSVTIPYEDLYYLEDS